MESLASFLSLSFNTGKGNIGGVDTKRGPLSLELVLDPFWTLIWIPIWTPF